MSWLTLTVILIGFILYRFYFNKLYHIPGPWLSAFQPSWKVKRLFYEDLNWSVKRLHDTHGPVVRLGPSEISFSTNTAYEAIYGAKGQKYFTRDGSMQGLFGPATEDLSAGLSHVREKDIKKMMKVLMINTYSELGQDTQEHIFNYSFSKSLDALHLSGAVSKETNLSEVLSEILWQFGGYFTFGQRLPDEVGAGLLKALSRFRWLAIVFEICFCAFNRSTIQVVFTTLARICRGTLVANPPPESCPGSRESEVKDNFYSQLSATAKKAGLPESQVMANALVTLLSAFVTLQSTVNGIFYYLLKEKACFDKLEQELLSSFDNVDDISDEILSKLPYLNACINEGIRLVPPFSSTILQKVSCGASIDGIFVPPGVGVTVDTYTLFRSKTYFEDPETFKPERWSSKNLNDDLQTFRPFGIGSGACPGRQLTLQFLRLLLAKMLFLFKMEMVNKDFVLQRDSTSSLSWLNFDIRIYLSKRGYPS